MTFSKFSILSLFLFLSFFAQAYASTPPPGPIIHVDPDTILNLSCLKPSYEVYGYSVSPDIEFYWKLPNGVIKNTNAIVISYPGEYVLVGKDPVTQDSSIQKVHVYENNNVYSNIYFDMENNPPLCGDTISASASNGFISYWFTPYGTIYSDEVVIYEEGIYAVSAISNTGCENIQSITVTQDCHFARVEGEIYYDYNQNQVREADEPFLDANVAQKIDIASTIVHAPLGQYYKYLDYDQQVIVDWVDDPKWILTTDNDETPVTGTVNTLTTIDFGLYPAFQHHDMAVYIPYSAPRCNTEVTFKNRIYNSGTYVEEGKIEVSYGDLVTFVSTDGTHNASLKTISWDYSDLSPLKRDNVGEMTFLMPDENSIGEEIDLLAKIYILSNGAYVLKDSYHFQPTVHCAFDPNQKAVSPGGVGDKHLTLLGQDLTYIVQFENEGNASAENVYIKDQIDDNLDISTLRILGASHPVQPWTTGNKTTFVFESINLQPEEKGYVEFLIKQQPDLPEFTEVENIATIFFDQNGAITTNSTINTLVSAIPYADTSGTKCIPFTVRYHAETIKDIHWTFPGAQPTSSQEKDILVTYTKPGLCQTKLFLNDAQYIFINFQAHDVPNVDFSLSFYDMVAKFTNNTSSTLATTYLWDFGDGTTSIEENPSHTYLPGSSYNIMLTATNECGATTQSRNLMITANDDIDDANFALELFPNPNKGQFTILVENDQAVDMELLVWDVLGRQVFEQKWNHIQQLNTKVNVSNLPKGSYHYAFHSGAKRRTGLLTIE